MDEKILVSGVILAGRRGMRAGVLLPDRPGGRKEDREARDRRRRGADMLETTGYYVR